jgi:hypothetical protein
MLKRHRNPLKYILSVFFLGIGVLSFGQQWIVTLMGLRNAGDTTKKYIIIADGNLSAKKLYDNALKYIDFNNADSTKMIRNKWDSVDLIFDTYVDSDHQLLIRGKYLNAFIVYKNNGKLYKPRTKTEIENYFNLQARMISVFLNQE